MRIAVLGCGAVGGVVAACMTRAGYDVTPIVSNPRIEAALINDGFSYSELDGQTSRIPTSRSPVKKPQDADCTFDLVICAVPSTALEDALKDVTPFLTNHARVVTCQNGLPEDRAAATIGDRVIGCVVGWGAAMNAPGVYQRTSTGRLQIGKASPACPSPSDLVSLLEAVSPVEIVDDLAGVRWSKLAINCVTSPFGAIGGKPLGPLLKIANVRRLALEVFAEVAEVARRQGVKMRPVAGTMDITKVAINDRERHARVIAPTLLLKHLLLLIVGYKFRRMRSSMLYALERGRPIEIDYLNGEIIKRGKHLGVPTPVNSAIIDTVKQIEQKNLTPSPRTLTELYDKVSAELATS
jgi:2-dehydropantoate 2-reductase